MASGWRDNFTITLITAASSYTSTTDITSDVHTIPSFTDTGGDEVNSCQIVLRARNGKFLTTTPVLADYDRIRVQGTDEDSNDYDRIFEIAPKPDAIIPSEDREGTLATLNLLGIEYHLQKIKYSTSHWFDDIPQPNPFTVIEAIGDSYNANKGTLQPELFNHDTAFNNTTKLGNDAPDWIVANFPWGKNPQSHWQRMADMGELLSAAVDDGGALDFFGLGFDTRSGNFNQIDLRFFSLGSTPTSPLTIQGNTKGTDTNAHGDTEGGFSPPTGTLVEGWFSENHGSLPVDFSRFVSAEQTFEFRPEWNSSRLYKINARVKYLGGVWKRIDTDVSGTPPFTNPASDSDWVAVDEGDEFGDSIQYSPWTDDKAVLWVNGYTHPDFWTTPTESGSAWTTSTSYSIGDTVQNTLFYVCKVAHTSQAADEPGVGASWEDKWHRTSWASGINFDENDIIVHNSVQYRCDDAHTSGASTEPGVGASWEDKWDIIENAKLGQNSDNQLTRIPDSNIVIFDDKFFRTWVNYKATTPSNVPSQYLYGGTNFYRGFRVLVNGTGTGDFSGTDKNNVDYDNSVAVYDGAEWVVKYKTTSSTDTMQVVVIHDGTVYEWNNSGGTWDDLIDEDQGVDCLHPVDAVYNTVGIDERPQDDSWTSNKYSAVEMVSSWNALDHRLLAVTPDANQDYYKKFAGAFFWFPWPLSTWNGVGENVGQLFGGSTSTGQEPATLDTENMSLTPTGKTGFNQSDSEAFGPINSIDLAVNMHYSSGGGDDTLLNEGNFKFRAAIGDDDDNVKIQDFTIPFNNNITFVPLPLTGFKQYRARKPRYDGFAEFIPPKDIEVLDKFKWRDVKWMSVHWLGTYDKFGRYFPEERDADILGTLFNIPKILGETIRFQIDAFHFRKPLLKITETQSTRNIEEGTIKDVDVLNYDQANGIVFAELEKQQFKHRSFDIDHTGTFAIRYGDSFFYANDRIVNDNDDGANTIKVVCLRAEHSITSRGFRTRFIVSKRFTS